MDKELKATLYILGSIGFLVTTRDFINFGNITFQIISAILLNIGIVWLFIPEKTDFLNSSFAFLLGCIVGIGFNLAQLDGLAIIIVSISAIKIYFKYKEKIYFHPLPLLLILIELLVIKYLFDPKFSLYANYCITTALLIILWKNGFVKEESQQPADNPI